MLRMQAGSILSFGELYDRHRVRAVRVARSICPNRESAEEAVQDAFESIWCGRAGYRADRGPVLPWAMAVVRHRALAIVRKRTFPLLRDVSRHPPEAASPADELVDGTVASDESQRLHAALALIPATQREVITLAFFGQLSHTEIAERLGLAAGTVKGRVRLGLDKLRADLGTDGSFAPPAREK